ncbi:MAG: 2-alkenal reductase [Parcubacteria group bacterium GW2011_GWA2_47_12]|nr:MAG: 2-alkenal reductase [Parcubacteria group bacterium GW2011_GWA2_47_12]
MRRKKDENTIESENPQRRDFSSDDGGLTTELTEHRREDFSVTRAVTMGVLSGLVFGVIGGAAGSVFVYPWYQKNILKTNPAVISENGRQIILDEESAVISAVEKINPAVVSIVVTKDLPKFEQFAPFGDFFFQIPSETGETERTEIGAGSGFIVTADGLIVTNRHVVFDPEADYTVITKDGLQYAGKILATDPFNDLAVVKIEAANLPVVKLGDSDSLKLGQRVIAIGNALGEFQNTVTTGVVSGIGRDITASGGAQTEKLTELIQTDAAINPGNSGGPLISLSGEVIGVNTAVSQSAQLIGFAIPINQVKKVIDDVREFGKVRRPFLGVRYSIITPNVALESQLSVDYGILLIGGDVGEPAVVPGSPAAAAGLSEGDIILEIDGVRITASRPLVDILREYSPGDHAILKILSGGTESTVSVTLGEAQ